MSIRVKRMGEESLLTRSEPITDLASMDVKSVIREMKDTMIEKRGVGIAAPQIGYNLRIIIFGFEHSDRYPSEKAIPFTVLVNPVLECIGDELQDGWEGCLSIPGMRGLVPRYKKIKYSGTDEAGNLIQREVTGFHARVLQHEYDHLEGILFPQRIKNMCDFGFEDVLWEKIYGVKQ